MNALSMLPPARPEDYNRANARHQQWEKRVPTLGPKNYNPTKLSHTAFFAANSWKLGKIGVAMFKGVMDTTNLYFNGHVFNSPAAKKIKSAEIEAKLNALNEALEPIREGLMDLNPLDPVALEHNPDVVVLTKMNYGNPYTRRLREVRKTCNKLSNMYGDCTGYYMRAIDSDYLDTYQDFEAKADELLAYVEEEGPGVLSEMEALLSQVSTLAKVYEARMDLADIDVEGLTEVGSFGKFDNMQHAVKQVEGKIKGVEEHLDWHEGVLPEAPHQKMEQRLAEIKTEIGGIKSKMQAMSGAVEEKTEIGEVKEGSKSIEQKGKPRAPRGPSPLQKPGRGPTSI